MIAYSFRVLKDNAPVGWVGFAFAQNMRDLFWQIDAHVDPYSVEVLKALEGSAYALQIEKAGEYHMVKHEIIGCHYEDDDDAWKKPVWVTDPHFVV